MSNSHIHIHIMSNSHIHIHIMSNSRYIHEV